MAIGHIGLNVRFFPFRELTPASEADATEKNRGIRGSPLKLLLLSVIAIFYGIHFRDRVQPHKSLVLPRGDAQQRRPGLRVVRMALLGGGNENCRIEENIHLATLSKRTQSAPRVRPQGYAPSLPPVPRCPDGPTDHRP